MSHTRRILAIDPGLTMTAGALIIAGPKEELRGRFYQSWTIKPKGDTLPMRLFNLLREVESVIARAEPTILVIEMPADRAMGGPGRSFNRRSIMSLPNYGAAVGVCVAASAAWGESEQASAQLFPSSSDWTGGDVPSSKDDEYKEKRVAYVQRLWNLPDGELGPKTTAGNVADAALIARWGLWRTNP